MERLLPDRGEDADVARHRAALMAKVAAGAALERSELGDRALPPRLPNYRLIRVIGSGAAAEVWEAHDAAGARVAVKLFHARNHARDHDRNIEKVEDVLLRELSASRRIDHPGIVRVLDVGESEDRQAFLVMELIEGDDLGELLAREGPLTWPRARGLLLQLCDALASAHTRGVVHRDLKPTNIMIDSTARASERAVVVDLGLSRLLGDSVVSTIAGALVGTPAYMSPEQIRAARVDHRADIYALGCIAYEMLAGQRPFGGVTAGECAVQHLVATPPVLEADGPARTTRALARVLARAMSKDPSERYASMEAFAVALQAVDEARAHAGPRVMLSGLVGLAVFVVVGGTLGWERMRASAVAADASMDSPPVEVPTPRRVVDLDVSLAQSCAVSEDGQLHCWGQDMLGRLGRGTEGESIGDDELPADVDPLPLEGVARVFAAGNARHLCALDREGALRCWGYGAHGELGLGSTGTYGDEPSETLDRLEPLALPGPVVDVALGTSRTCAIVGEQAGRNLYCWGRGEHGGLGVGGIEDVGDDEAVDAYGPVPLGASVRAVALGNDHTCALLEGGALRCWGAGARGQLGVHGWSANIGDGVGDGRERGLRPDSADLQVAGLEGVEIAVLEASGDRSCVLTQAGGVRCWGSAAGAALGYRWDQLPGCGANEQLDHCGLEAPLPVDIDFGQLEGKIVELALGQRHACVVDELGQARCWGEGPHGRLGHAANGYVGHWRSPAETWRSHVSSGIVDLGDSDGDGVRDPVAKIAAGMAHTCALMVAGGVRCWGAGDDGRLGYGAIEDIGGKGQTPAEHYAALGLFDVSVYKAR